MVEINVQDRAKSIFLIVYTMFIVNMSQLKAHLIQFKGESKVHLFQINAELN